MLVKIKNKSRKLNMNLLQRKGIKPDFTYIKPINIDDEQFPDDIQSDNQYTQTTNNQKPSLLGDQTVVNTQKMQKVYQSTRIKFDKSVFIKIKLTNYKIFYKTISKCIGKGAFGTVSKVQSLSTKQQRAAKIIKQDDLNQQQIQKLFQQVRIMMQLDHHNIANLLQVYEFNNSFTLICQLCQGGDLLKYLKFDNKSNCQRITGKIIKQILRAVIYLHSKGIVHRDIKPHNVLFGKNNSFNIKLIDFGIAVKITPGQILNVRVGTPAYLAPQLILEKYNQKVDVWAVGITMYHIIAGNIPFRGNTIKDTICAIIKQKLVFKQPIWKNISEQCKQVIRLMVTKDPKERPSAKEIFQNQYFKNIQENQLTSFQMEQFADNICKFQFKNKLQSSIQTFVASQLLSIEQKKQLAQYFKQFDQDNDGVISKQQLIEILQIKKKISKQRVQAIMNMMDTNGSGKIDFTEFVASCYMDSREFTVNRLKQAFEYFDTNKNGRISLDEVKFFMKDLTQSDRQLSKFFQDFDINGDGSISQIQFIHIMLQRSKYMALSKSRISYRQQNQVQKRIDPVMFNKLYLEYMLEGGQSFDFFKNLMGQKKHSTNQNSTNV